MQKLLVVFGARHLSAFAADVALVRDAARAARGVQVPGRGAAVVAGASGRPFPRLPTRAAVIAQRRRGQRPTGVSASAASAAPPPGEAAGPRCVRWSAASASAAPGNGAFSMIKYIHFLIQAGKRYPRACRNERGLAERQPAPAGRMAPAAEWTVRAPLGSSERQAGRRQQQAGGRARSDCRPARRSGRAAVWTARAPWRGSARADATSRAVRGADVENINIYTQYINVFEPLNKTRPGLYTVEIN